MELAIVARRAIARIESRNIKVERVYMGRSCRPWKWPAFRCRFSRSMTKLLALLDSPTDAPAWPNAVARSRTRPPVHSDLARKSLHVRHRRARRWALHWERRFTLPRML